MTFPKPACGSSFHPHLLFFHSSVMFSTDDTGAIITGNCCSITYRRHYAGDPVGSRRRRVALSYHHYVSSRGNKICGRQQQHTTWLSLQQQFKAKSIDANWVLGMFCALYSEWVWRFLSFVLSHDGKSRFCDFPVAKCCCKLIFSSERCLPLLTFGGQCRISRSYADFLWHGYSFLSPVSDLVSVFWPLWEMALGEKKENLLLLWWCEEWPSLQPLFHCRDLKEREERKASLAHLEPLDPLVPKDPLEMTVQRATL